MTTTTNTNTTTAADAAASAVATALAALPAAALSAIVRNSPGAKDALLGEFRPYQAASLVVMAHVGPKYQAALDAAGGVRRSDSAPLADALAALVGGWPPEPAADLDTQASASAECRKLAAASAAGYDVDSAAAAAALDAYAKAWQ